MKIYTASKTKHAHFWLEMRKKGFNVISTWIDEAGENSSPNLKDLCQRCISESAEADIFLLYVEENDMLKGALIEAGIAMYNNKHIICVDPFAKTRSVFHNYHKWQNHNHLIPALKAITDIINDQCMQKENDIIHTLITPDHMFQLVCRAEDYPEGGIETLKTIESKKPSPPRTDVFVTYISGEKDYFYLDEIYRI